MQSLTLYSTDNCSLCEAALDVLLSMPELAGIPLSVVDVAGDPGLLDRFGERIPILVVGKRILEWPFEPARLVALLEQS